MADLLDEPILDDDYPVYPGYHYVADDNWIVCPIEGTVGGLKSYLQVGQIRRCDIIGRQQKYEAEAALGVMGNKND